MSFESIYVVWEVMLCRRKCLVEVMCWCGACLYDGISCYLFGLTGRHFLLDDMICLRVRIVGEYEYEFILTLTYRAGSHTHFVHLFNW